MAGSSPSLSLRNLRIIPIIKMPVIIKASVSAIGKEYQTPRTSSHNGRRYTSGTRKSSWRVRERKILLFTIPKHWKKLVETICMPTKIKAIFIVCKPLALRAKRCVVGKDADCGLRKEFGKNEAEYTNRSCPSGCKQINLTHTAVLSGPVIIAGYWLHSLIQAHDYHQEEETDTVSHAISAYGKITSYCGAAG